ncbi:MAG: tungsten ABC transporter substrate-binding protein, partial [Acidimicrobiia bacterium]
VVASRFVLVGPPDRVGDLAGLPITRALGEIAAREWTFISRADGSGTHAAELRLWREAGFDPSPEPWYLETGQSMGLTLQVADQRGAFTLAEVGAFRAAAETLALVPADVVEHHPGALSNPYHATVVTGGAEQPALRFLRWLRSTDGRTAVIAMNLELFGEVLYEPAG